MARRRPTSSTQSKQGTVPPVPQRRGATVSELDEYIHLGEEKDSDDDLFDDVPDDEDADDDAAPIPQIAATPNLRRRSNKKNSSRSRS